MNQSIEALKAELEQMREQCSDLASRVQTLQEQQNDANREARRWALAAKMGREAYGLIDIARPGAGVRQRLLGIVLDNLGYERAVLLLKNPGPGHRFQIEDAVGLPAPDKTATILLDDPVSFLILGARSPEVGKHAPLNAALRKVIGVPYIAWVFNPPSGVALLLGARAESHSVRPLDPDDPRQLQLALDLYLDIFHRNRALSTGSDDEISSADARSGNTRAGDARAGDTRADETRGGDTRASASFLANFSHELRTPLNAIIGFSEILRDELFGAIGNARYKQYAADIHASGRHLYSLIEDILDYSRLDAGHSVVEADWMAVPDAIGAALVMISQSAETAGISLDWWCEPAMPPLLADVRRVRQILINLLANAVKFTPKGGSVKVQAYRGPDGRMVLEVSDTGIGIAPRDLPRVLEPFGQVDNALNRRHTGTGLGLPLSKALIERHGGVLEIESELGKGTIVRAIFPKDRVGHGGGDPTLATAR